MLNSLWKKRTLSLQSDEPEFAKISSKDHNASDKSESYAEDYEVYVGKPKKMFDLENVSLKTKILALFPFFLLVVFLFVFSSPESAKSHHNK